MAHFILLFLLLLATSSASADTIRVCTYSLGDGTREEYYDSLRRAEIGLVLQSVNSDILVVQGCTPNLGVLDINAILGNGLAVRNLMAYSFSHGLPVYNAVFYDTNKVRRIDVNNGGLILPKLVDTSEWSQSYRISGHEKVRDINDWPFIVKATGDTLHLLVCQFMEGDWRAPSGYYFQRIEQAVALRRHTDSLPTTHHWIVAGELNIPTSSDLAYTVLTKVVDSLPGHVSDPLNRPGDWKGNPAFADVHTWSLMGRDIMSHSHRVGTLINRYDFLLLSQRLLKEHYVQGSYITYGNDGQHFRDSINRLPNMAVPDSIAQALYHASSHLPVYLDLRFN
jgi:hypothetical protein